MSPQIRPRRRAFVILSALVLAFAVTDSRPHAQGQTAPSGVVAGRNVNMVSGLEWPNGDPYLQRQNEPSVAASTRNPLHLLGGANDYRTVDMPFPPDGEVETGDAWLGLFKSFDGGQRWISNLVPGYPQDVTESGLTSPLKGYNAAADPVVRAGTHGLFYYSGLVFDRGEFGESAIFVARYIDNNNKETGDPIAYLGTSIVASDPGTTSRFLDKPWMAVDMPRHGAATCTITTPGEDGPILQHIPAGTVYVAFTAITGEGPSLRAEILFTRSLDCGQTWSQPVRVSRAEDPINQGATIAIDPRTGSVYVAWRRFSLPGTADDQDAILVARSVTFGRKWLPPGVARRFPRGQKVGLMLEKFFEHRKPKGPVEVTEVSEFDQVTSADAISFRTNAYPAMAIDDRGRLYVAWSERGFATTLPSPVDGDARVLIATSPNGSSWTSPRVVEELGQPGHQIMPSLGVANGKVLIAYYDLREDRSQVFAKYVDDKTAIQYPVEPGKPRRHTIDLRASMAPVGSAPVFGPSVRVSEYRWGFRSATGPFEQLQVNPPNLPMFRQGTVPFFGDYVDLAPAPSFVPLANGQWAFAVDGAAPPVFHAVWTDNRDVRPPSDGDWAKYTPPNSSARPTNSRIDGSPLPPCQQAFAATRNQNVYTARLTGGLLVGSPGNAKPLHPMLQRAFVVFAHNTTNQIRSFRLTIASQPPGGRASFEQFPLPPYDELSPPPVTTVDVTTAPRSLAARTVYVTSTDPDSQVTVDVVEITTAGGTVVSGGLTGRILLNPDVENPDVENPDVENPDVENPDVENAEVYTPDVENPDVENPDVENPDVENPDVENPDVENVNVANPDVENPDVENPDVENPDVENPDVENPDVENPDVENGAISDVSWTVTNNGNTTSAYSVDLFLTSGVVPPGIKVQLILHKLYKTPISYNCDLKFETQNVLVANIPDPRFLGPYDPTLPDPNSPDVENATLWLGPGESAKITLRIVDPDKSNNVIVNGASIDPAFVPGEVTLGMVQQSVNSDDARGGTTAPPIVTSSGSTIFFVPQPTDTRIGRAIQPYVRVQVRDNTGAVLPGTVVSLALGANPGGATLAGGGPAVGDTNGIATFPNLQLDRVGFGYTLLASASTPDFSIPPATSVPFTVFDACAADGVARLQHYVVDGPDVSPGPIALAGGGDFDGDGFEDPVVLTSAESGGYFTIMTNSGFGAFRWTFSTGGGPGASGPRAIAVADFNGDGRSDIALANELSDNVTAFLGLAGSPPVGSPSNIGVTDDPVSLAAADFDGDGYADLAAGGAGANVSILRGGASGLSAWVNVLPGGGTSARDLAVADFNGDGRPDLAVADPGSSGVGTLWIFTNNGAGFDVPVPYSVGESVAVVAADFSGDTWPDLAVGNLNGEVRLLVNDGAGGFTSGLAVALPAGLQSIAAGDFDGDGHQDVAVAPGVVGEDRFFLLLGNGTGVLAGPTTIAGGPGPWDVLAGDLNRDGRTDLAIANNQLDYVDDVSSTTMSVLLNDCNTATADLTLTYALPPAPSPVGDDATWVATVTNHGPFPATAVSLVQTLSTVGTPPTFVSVTPSAGSCSGTGPITCDLGTIAPDSSATVTLVVTPTSPGSLGSDWVARAAELDTSPLDNTRRASIAIVAADLVVESLAHQPENPTTVDTMIFRAVVRNIGTGPAGPSTLMFTVGGETPGAEGTLYAVPGLAAGATHTVQRQLTLDVAQGYQNTATADYNDAVTESSETNNTTIDTFTVSQPATFPGSISGTVYYSTNTMSGVTIELVQGDPRDPALQSTTTDQLGEYTLANVAPGTYWVKVVGPSAEYISWTARSVDVSSAPVTRDMDLPKVITLLSPARGAVVEFDHPTLVWTPNPEAEAPGGRYGIQVNATIGWVLVSVSSSQAAIHTVEAALTAGTNYTWQVDAYDASNHHVGTTPMAFTFDVAAPSANPAIEVARPLTVADGEGQLLTLLGRNLPTSPTTRAVFRQGGQTFDGFVFGRNDPQEAWVRLPVDGDPVPLLSPGLAEVMLTDGNVATNWMPLMVSTTPGAPEIRSLANLVPGGACGWNVDPPVTSTTVVTRGTGLMVTAYGIDTSGSEVVFTQGGIEYPVTSSCSMWGSFEGLGAVVVVPTELLTGSATVQIRTRVNGVLSALSPAVVVTVQ